MEEISLIIFYKVEEKGESIHATMNDINRKCWVIKNKEARLWKIIERYKLRNVTNIERIEKNITCNSNGTDENKSLLL